MAHYAAKGWTDRRCGSAPLRVGVAIAVLCLAAATGASVHDGPLVVGRSQSIHGLSAARNQSLVIVYHVFNTGDRPLAEAALQAQLQTGATPVSTDPAADQSGGILRWNLGAIPAGAAVDATVTLQLGGAPPVLLDGGAVAFAFLDGRPLRDAAIPAKLRDVPWSDALVRTVPEADLSDRFVRLAAARLDYDPAAAFAFVRDQVGYECYGGSLRGARGTLWSHAGNSLDQASLLIALLRASGYPARYAQGTLADTDAAQLIASMFPPPSRRLGYSDGVETPSDPASDPQLLATARAHYWAQYDDGGGFRDLDACFADHAMGDTRTTAAATFAEVDDSVRTRITVRLRAELQSAFPNTAADVPVVLEETFNAAAIAGKPLTVGHRVETTGAGGLAFSSITHTYTPYILVGEDDRDVNDDLTRVGESYQEYLTNFPLGSMFLTGVFMDIDVALPGGSVETYTSAFLDRVGFAIRRNGGTAGGLEIGQQPAFSDADVATITVLAGKLDESVIFASHDLLQRNAVEAERLLPDLEMLDPDDTSPDAQALYLEVNPVVREIQIASTRLLNSLFYRTSQDLERSLDDLFLMATYPDGPRIVVSRFIVDGTDENAPASIAVDLVRDRMRVVAAPGQETSVEALWGYHFGMAENALEGRMSDLFSRGIATPLTASRIIEAALAENIALHFITPETAYRVAGLDISDDAKARISVALGEGSAVIVPDSAVMIDGVPTIGWVETDASGYTVGRLEDGTGGAVTYAIFCKYAVRWTSFLGGVIVPIAFFGIDVAGEALGLINAGVDGAVAAKQAAAIALDQTADAVDKASKVVPKEGKKFYKAGSKIGMEAAGALAGEITAGADPAVQPFPIGLPSPAGGNVASVTLNVAPTLPAGSVTAMLDVSAHRLSGHAERDDTISGTTHAFVASSFTARLGTVFDAQGASVGSGEVTLPDGGAPAEAAAAGNYSLELSGDGAVSRHAAEDSPVAGAVWDSYSVHALGNISITFTSAELRIDGNALPGGRYRVETTDARWSGAGAADAPNFLNPASADWTDGALSISPAAGTLTIGGTPLVPGHGLMLLGFAGRSTETAGADSYLLQLAGSTQSTLQLSLVPSQATTDQNTPVVIDAALAGSRADAFTLDVEAPAGWDVTLDANGTATLTPAPGSQSGATTVVFRATSLSDPEVTFSRTATIQMQPTTPGVDVQIEPDPLLTVPFQGIEVPSAYRLLVHNLGPTAQTFELVLEQAPAGFSCVAGASDVTVSAGETGIVGLYLFTTGSVLPPPGTQATFRYRAASSSSSDTAETTFTMPSLPGTVLSVDPAEMAAAPGDARAIDVYVRNVGNVPDTSELVVSAPAIVSLAGLPAPFTLQPGQELVHSVTTTVDVGAAVGRAWYLAFTAQQAGADPDAFVSARTDDVQLRVESPEVACLNEAAYNAALLGSADLAEALAELAVARAAYDADPADPTLCAWVQRLLAEVYIALGQHPLTLQFADELESLIVLAGGCDMAQAFTDLMNLCDEMVAVMRQGVEHGFSLSLSPRVAELEPGQSAQFTLKVESRGTMETTVTLAEAMLPAGVSADFSATEITLSPGEVDDSKTLTLNQSLSETTVFALEVIGLTVQAPLLEERDAVQVAVREALADVVSVRAEPNAIDSGGSFQAFATLLNTANTERGVVARVEVVDASLAATLLARVPVQLSPGTGLLVADLGVLSASPIPDGLYLLRVSLESQAGSPIAGRSAETLLLIGSPVSAELSVSPEPAPPGSPTVTTTIRVADVVTLARAQARERIIALGTADDIWTASSALTHSSGDPRDVIGLPDGAGYFLAANDSLVVDFGADEEEIIDASGDDLMVVALSGPNTYKVEASEDGQSFEEVNSNTRKYQATRVFDLASGQLASARYVRITPKSGVLVIDALRALNSRGGVHVERADFTLGNEGNESIPPFATTAGVRSVIMVGNVDDDPTPEIAVIGDIHITGSPEPEKLEVIDGLTGALQFELPIFGNPIHEVALADIRPDIPGAEIVFPNPEGLKLVSGGGEVLWTLPVMAQVAPGLANLDNDPEPEIIAYSGIGDLFIINGDSTVAWWQNGLRPISFAQAADLIEDGTPEILAQHSAGRYMSLVKPPQTFGPSRIGTILWTRDFQDQGGQYGEPAIADVNGDGLPEIVLGTNDGFLNLIDASGETVLRVEIGGDSFSPPAVADINADGRADVVVSVKDAENGRIYAISLDGIQAASGAVVGVTDVLLWSAPARDRTSGTGLSVFDLDGDGYAEVIWQGYGDDENGRAGGLLILSGRDGTIIYQNPRINSITGSEYPTIADVDGDGHAEILTGDQEGLWIVGCDDFFVPTRDIWNQRSYHVTNVNDDMTIPVVEPPSWDDHNSYHTQRPPASGLIDLQVSVHHRLAGTGYQVEDGGILPAPLSRQGQDVRWTGARTRFTDPAIQEFRVAGVAPQLAPGETRQLSEYTIVDATFSIPLDQQAPLLLQSTPNPGSLAFNVDRIQLRFTEPLDPSVINLSGATLLNYGPDGVLGGGDDVPVSLVSIEPTGADSVLILASAALSPGNCRLSLDPAIVADLDGNHPPAPIQLFFTAASPLPGAVFWSKGASGDWDNPYNWSSGMVPQPGQDVVIDRAGIDLTVTHTKHEYAVHSLVSRNRFFMQNGTLTLTGPANFDGPLSMGDDAILEATGAAAGIIANASPVIDNGRFFAHAGADIVLGATSYVSSTGPNVFNHSMFFADGPGSSIDLSTLVHFDAIYGNLPGRSSQSIEAHNGGMIDLSNLTSLSGGSTGDDWLAVNISGGGDIDFSSLVALAGPQAVIDVSAATYSLPELRAATGTTFLLNDRAVVFNAPQLDWFVDSELQLSGQSQWNSLPLQNIDKSRFVLSQAATLVSPATRYSAPPGFFNSQRAIFGADGSGAFLDLSSLAELSMAFNTALARETIRASNQGRIDLSGVTRMTGSIGQDSYVVLSVVNGGVIDLDSLAEIDGQTQIEARQAGLALPALAAATEVFIEPEGGVAINMPVLQSLARGGITLDGTNTINAGQLASFEGSTLELTGDLANLNTPPWTHIDDARLHLYANAHLAVSATAYKAGNLLTNERRDIFIADGAGTDLSLSSLDELDALDTAAGTTHQRIVAGNGGLVDLSGLVTVRGGGATHHTLDVIAESGGKVDLSSVENIPAGYVTVIADGTGSVVDLSSLQVLDASRVILQSSNGGVILLGNGKATWVARVSRPVVPSELAASGITGLQTRATQEVGLETRATPQTVAHRGVAQVATTGGNGDPPRLVVVSRLELPPAVVAAEHVLAIDPPVASVAPGASTTFTLTVHNRLAMQDAYTLAVVGVEGYAPALAALGSVGGNDSATTTLALAVPAYVGPAEQAFTVVLSSSAGISDSVGARLVVTNDPPPGVGDARDVWIALDPAEATAGREMPTTFDVVVANLGSAGATYQLTGQYPDGVTGTLGENDVTLLPGGVDARRVRLTIAGATESFAFSVRAQAAYDPAASASATGSMHVLPFGVVVQLDPEVSPENARLTLRVSNTGTGADSFNLGLAGPAAGAATLESALLALAAGATGEVEVEVGETPFAEAGGLALIAAATSQAAPQLVGQDSARIMVAARRALAAGIAPASATLDTPAGAEFTLQIENRGNAEDTFRVEIVPGGPAVAGLDTGLGLAASIPDLILPPFSGASIPLLADLPRVGTTTVEVRITSLADALATSTVRAVVERTRDCFANYDLNGDLVIDVQDLLLLFGDAETQNLRSDFNCDAAVNHLDYYLFAAQWETEIDP